MKILILGLHYAPERVGIGVYSSGMAEALADMGHRVQVIAGQPFYPAWKIMDGYSAWSHTRALENGVDVLRCPHYVPARPSGVKRLLHHLSFALSALVPTLVGAWRDKPDVVFAVAPSLITAPLACLAAAVGGARSWLHVQDFEVEAAMATGLVDTSRRIARLALAFERMVLRGFDRVSSISPQMCRKLIEKGVAAERVVEFRNWADTDAIRPLQGPSPYRAEWNITTPHVALYSGSIGNKQGMEIVVEAARLLVHRTDLTFVVCGEGPNRARLEALATGLGNIRFHDLQPKERLGDLLGLASVHLLPQLADAADLVLPSKLGNMLASGRPVVATAAPGTGLADEVEGCGVVVPPGDAAAFAGGIARTIELYPECSPKIRDRAEIHWSARTSIGTLMQECRALAQEVAPIWAQR
jgi:colanic acid biosynthesis glycosyl transferase WcaI